MLLTGLEVTVDPPFFSYFFFLIYNLNSSSRALIGQSSCGAAHRRDAQLISWQVRVGTKEQLSGCWASASSPSDFSCKTKGGENRYREECRGEGASVLLEVLPSRRGEDRQAFCARFTRSCAAEALRSGHRVHATALSRRSWPTVDIFFFLYHS